ncbi:hypothetical protein A4G19_01725 [Pasteurellaceae bacterium Macca]|nr:hypothetical protein [Pasteurellaceae bacterium Macca]
MPNNFTEYNIVFFLLTLIGIFIFMHFLHKLYKKQNKEKTHLFIDAVRGFCALSILFHHAILSYYHAFYKQWQIKITPPFPNTIMENVFINSGQASVALFFMITSFLFFSKFLFSENYFNATQFFKKRIYRIVPMYVVSVILIFILAIYLGIPKEYLTPKALLHILLRWLSFGYYPGHTITLEIQRDLINAGVFWTLIIEWKFYLLFPLLLAFCINVRSTLYTIAFCFILALGLFYANLIKLIDFVIINYFIIGAISALIYKTKSLKIDNILKSKMTSIIIISLFLFNFLYNVGSYSYLGNFCLGIFFIAVSNGNSCFKILSFKPLSFLGKISYSIYLLHGIILSFVNLYLFPKGNYLINTSIVIILTITLSYFTFKYIEQPFMKKGSLQKS